MIEGDTNFLGEDSRQDPAVLGAGMVSRAENMEFGQGIAETRKGMRAVWWAARLGVSFPHNFPYNFDQSSGLGEVLGAGVFSDPFGKKYIMVATPQGVWRCAEGCEAEMIPYGKRLTSSTTTGGEGIAGFVLFLALDCTGSIGVGGAQRGIEIIDEFRGKVGDSKINGIGFVAFSDDICEVQAVSADLDAVRARLVAVVESGGSDPDFFCSGGGDTPENGVDALARALTELAGSAIAQASQRRYIFLKTDTGGYAHNSADPVDVYNRLTGAGVSRTWLEFDPGNTSLDDEGEYAVTFPADGSRIFHGDFDPEAVTSGVTTTTTTSFAGIVVTEAMHVLQAFDKVFLFRGRQTGEESGVAGSPRPLMWEGRKEFSDATLGYFEEVSDEAATPNTLAMPAAERALYFANRIFPMIGNRMPPSDIRSYTVFRTEADIFLNEGSSDKLVTGLGLGSQIIVFKDSTIMLVDGVYGDLTNVTIQTITTARGCIAPRTAVLAGRDVPFLSYGGVWTLSQALDNRLQAGQEPLSAAIEPRMRRINWAYAKDACAVVHENRYYLAVPMDGAKYNNAVLVYDYINRAWCGMWTGKWMDIAALVVAERLGKDCVIAVMGSNLDALNAGALFAFDAGLTDNRWGEDAEIEWEVETRGYAMGDPGRKQFTSLETEVESWHGAWETFVIRDGVNEVRSIGVRTKDRRESYLAEAPVYDPSNLLGSLGAPYRKDYSMKVAVDETPIDEVVIPIEDWDLAVPQGISLETGISPDRHQAAKEGFKLREQARSVRVRLKGLRGRVRLLSTKIEGGTPEEAKRTKA